MHRFSSRLALAFTFALAVACGDKAATPAQTETRTEQPAGVIPQAQIDALNKAKSVQDTVMDQAQKTRDAIDDKSM